jgi:RNA-directed DNA polymerase
MSRQLELPLEGTGEARRVERSEEAPTAAHRNERSGASDLMAKVCERRNLQAALKRVRRNKGSPGIDGMTVDELPDHLRGHWPVLREQLLAGRYQPLPERRTALSKAALSKTDAERTGADRQVVAVAAGEQAPHH